MSANYNILKTIHWPSIRMATWFSVFVLGGSAILLFASGSILSILHDQLAREEGQLQEFQLNYEDALTETRLIKQYSSNYQQLLTKKFIGDEDRLNWVEIYRQIRNSRNLPELNYTFQPIVSLPGYPGALAQDFQLYATESTLEFILYDETDLQAIFKRLSDSAHGYFTVDSCELNRKQAALQLNIKGNIKGSCKITWLSIQRIPGSSSEIYSGSADE